ncbi:MAG: siderophore-interacting protein [Tessaracoccus sp.]|uniref:siderophore-interacting protein n=1 Tax=Tessaracoccus sp. TaxID=1971211 RepID=UPI001EBBAE89|nr:siderophore-interacting protein [Tessaracoccus sp.]MBK7821028.1 siderophore-interacting protein [Tessaracoccus sp.]
MTKAGVNLVHRVEVAEVHRLTPGMVRVVFAGEGLDGFRSTGVGDEYLRLFLPAEGHVEPTLPEPTEDGYWRFLDGVEPAVVRTYTVRAWDEKARRVTIDFVVHDGGVAARWALGARPGHVVGMNTPRGLYAPGAAIEWQLLVADAAGLPAALRLAGQTPPGVRTRVVIEVPGPDHEHPVALAEGVELVWVHGGNGHGPSRLEDIVRATKFPPGPGYVWVAGSAKVTRAVRRYLRHELRWPSSAYKVVGYWTEDLERWLERYDALDDDVRARLRDMWADSERDVEEVTDEYEATLEALGL